MAIPDYQTLMLPLLKFSSDKKEHSLREAVDVLSNQFKLTEEEQRELLPSGQQPIFVNRVGWARSYLKQAALLETTRRGYFKITNRGIDILSQHPNKITAKYLEQFNEFRDFRSRSSSKAKIDKKKEEEPKTPEEILDSAYENLREELASELLLQFKDISPSLFEKIVVDLLIKMGYGGSRKDAGEALGKSGDGGIDGIIKEDKLGLDIIYIQAKKWVNTVPVKEIRDFAGALLSKKARKGIFITTSSFPKSVYDFVNSIEHKIILIDGNLLTKLMIDHNVGLSIQNTYAVQKMDLDYFTEE